MNLDEESIIADLTPETSDDIDIPKVKKTIDYHLNAAKKYSSRIPDADVRIGMFSINVKGIRSVLIKKHMGIVQRTSGCHMD